LGQERTAGGSEENAYGSVAAIGHGEIRMTIVIEIPLTIA
jgi:hypothetical protein